MVTINDVARRAGVSVSTVSYTLSGKRTISASTRARVERAIAELGYHPHAGARALASARTNIFALMAPLRPDVDVSVIMQFVTGVVTRARTADYDVLLLTQDEADGVGRVGSGSLVDALILMDVESDDPRIPQVAALRQPTILIGLPEDARGVSCVDFDFEAAARLSLRHLTALGHRNVALIGPPPAVIARHTSYADRLLRGYRAQAEHDGVGCVIEPAGTAPGEAVAALDAVLTQVPELTGLVVHNEAALPVILATLRDRGRRVPEDISVVALAPADVADAQPVPITAMDIPALNIGQVAVDMALARLRGSDTVETRLIAPTLHERSSTAPPR
ncbi:LacI family DNA-binding transcriptional regulator [Occultella gossypii]|uniref:LacI family DNA-binding transcriptional regulator n=1 Tax=Occultella gossypii TaxID=2800820 RepID=A0ABS7S7H1_9MICO|nr:LacI family DNA-binding transcriptional regulator [Occultella gossypii]MBZ2196290.1 LacI family DNA-binding transcriptional regulator [Occultella gossypii]